MDGKLARFLAVGAWKRGYCAKWVSRLFLVPKPGTNKWRLIIDLRPLNRYCETRDLSFETLSHLRNLARPGDYMLQIMDLQDGFYANGIAHEDRDFFTVDYRGTLYRLAGLTMGWSLSPYYFCQFTNVLTRALRRNPAEADGTPIPRRRFGLRMLPYMDDFLFLVRTQAEAIWQRDYIQRHLSGFGLLRNPNKGVWEPTQKLVRLRLEIDTSGSPTLRAPAEKLAGIARAAKRLIQRAKRNRRWLLARELAALAGKCQFLYLAIAPARFYLRELHDVLKTRDPWSGRVKLTRELERDLAMGTAEEQPTAASRPGKEGLEAEPAVMRQPQLLQHQVVLAALVVVVDARAPSEVPQDHVWTRPTPSTVERRTMRLPAGLPFRCNPVVA
eukprot:jgi/Tetstr1/447837/TSEL_003755.t1